MVEFGNKITGVKWSNVGIGKSIIHTSCTSQSINRGVGNQSSVMEFMPRQLHVLKAWNAVQLTQIWEIIL